MISLCVEAQYRGYPIRTTKDGPTLPTKKEAHMLITGGVKVDGRPGYALLDTNPHGTEGRGGLRVIRPKLR